jgi:hypothetical protein
MLGNRVHYHCTRDRSTNMAYRKTTYLGKTGTVYLVIQLLVDLHPLDRVLIRQREREKTNSSVQMFINLETSSTLRESHRKPCVPRTVKVCS